MELIVQVFASEQMELLLGDCRKNINHKLKVGGRSQWHGGKRQNAPLKLALRRNGEKLCKPKIVVLNQFQADFMRKLKRQL